jgi:hypothetical protein
VFLLTLALYVATTGGSMATDIMTYEVTKGIVEQGTVAMSYNVYQMEAHRGVDGRYYAPYGLGHALYNVPFYLVGLAAEKWSGLSVGKSEAIRKGVVVLGSALATALSVWVAFLFAWRLGGKVAAAVESALVLGFGTLFWPYAKFGFNAPLATFCVLFGTYAVWVGIRSDRPRMLVLAGMGLGSALLVRHELALVCLPVGWWIAAESKYDLGYTARRGALVAGPVIVAVLLTLGYNYTRFGNPLDAGYLRDQTANFGSFWDGLFGLLVSPGRSLFLYSPITLVGLFGFLWLYRSDRSTAQLFAGQSVLVLLFYSSLEYWDADRSYGPRYLLPVIPMLVLPLTLAGSRSAATSFRKMLPMAITISIVVQLPGVLVDFSKVGYTPEIGKRSHDERRWTWEAAGLRLNSRAVADVLPRNVRYLTGLETPPLKPARGEARDFSEQFAFSLDFWWVYLFYLGVMSAPVAITLGAGCLGAAGLFGWFLRREICRV